MTNFSHITRFSSLLGQVILAFMVLTICYDAGMRYAFAAPTSWSHEVNTFLIIYVALLTAADVQRTDDHIRITFFTDRMPGAVQKATAAVISVIGVAFCGVMAWRGAITAAQAFEYGERVSSSFGTPLFIPYALLPIGFGLLAIQFACNLFPSAKAESATDPGLEPVARKA